MNAEAVEIVEVLLNEFCGTQLLLLLPILSFFSIDA